MQHFLSTIEGQNVIVYTDHKPIITAFVKTTNRSPKQSRQFSFISEFVNEIKHITGRNNNVADALSRVEVESVREEELASAQENDGELQDWLLRTSYPINRSVIKNGRTIIRMNQDNRQRPYIPTDLRKRIFESIHNRGHPSIRATRKEITKRYFWPNMNKDINEWSATCLSCQQSKIYRHTKLPPVPIRVPSDRFKEINVDIVSPLSPNRKGHRYLLTMIDRFTRWPEVKSMSSITAEETARTLVDSWICRYGVPEVITTDRGSQFEGQLFKQITKILGCDHMRTVPYNPRANGMIERFH